MRKIILAFIIASAISCGPSKKEQRDKWNEQIIALTKQQSSLLDSKRTIGGLQLDSAQLMERGSRIDAEMKTLQGRVDSLQQLIDGQR